MGKNVSKEKITRKMVLRIQGIIPFKQNMIQNMISSGMEVGIFLIG
jgi:hypothetical protein